jgi:hypothetical protein
MVLMHLPSLQAIDLWNASQHEDEFLETLLRTCGGDYANNGRLRRGRREPDNGKDVCPELLGASTFSSCFLSGIDIL